MATTKRDGAAERSAEHDLSVLRQYAEARRPPALSTNLGRFAVALAAGNAPEDAATMARTRATADRVEFALEAALDRSRS